MLALWATYLVSFGLQLTGNLDEVPTERITPDNLGHHVFFAFRSKPWVAGGDDLNVAVSRNLAKLSECAFNKTRGGQAISVVPKLDHGRRRLALLAQATVAEISIAWSVDNEERGVRIHVVEDSANANERRKVIGQKQQAFFRSWRQAVVTFAGHLFAHRTPAERSFEPHVEAVLGEAVDSIEVLRHGRDCMDFQAMPDSVLFDRQDGERVLSVEDLSRWYKSASGLCCRIESACWHIPSV